MNTPTEIEELVKIHDTEVAKANFQIFDKGENWWTFRRNPNSFEQSFTVTILQDGTVTLTGDYGFLAFQRDWYPKDKGRPFDSLWGFPATGTNITYFIEKIKALEVGTSVMDWDEERAYAEIKAVLRKNCPAEVSYKLAAGSLTFHTKEEMHNELHNLDEYIPDFCDYRFGEYINVGIFWQFSLLKVWGDFTLQQELNKS